MKEVIAYKCEYCNNYISEKQFNTQKHESICLNNSNRLDCKKCIHYSPRLLCINKHGKEVLQEECVKPHKKYNYNYRQRITPSIRLRCKEYEEET